MNIGQEFQNYYVKHLGKGSLDLHNFSSQIESSMTPYILEEREMRTVNTGMAASMGSVLLGAGTKGKRSSLRFSRTMLHQSSGGFGGNIQDAEISMKEWNKLNDILFDLLGEFCGKNPEQVKLDATRDLWLDSEQALEYGIIDEIVKTKKKGK